MSNSNVFEQHQKYFESLIARHREACKLENQNAQTAAVQQMPLAQPQPQQAMIQPQPTQQQASQPQQMMPQQAQPQQQQQQPPPVAIRQLPAPPMTHQPAVDMYGSRRQEPPPPLPPMQQQQQRYDNYYDQDYDYGYQGRGAQPWSARRGQTGAPPPAPPTQYINNPDEYCQYYYSGYAPDQMLMQQSPPLPPQQQPLPQPLPSAFRPDGRVNPSPDDVEKLKPTFCYPNGVNGYQGGGPCGPCTSCRPAAQDPAVDNPVTLQQRLQQRRKQIVEQPPLQQQQQQQQQQQPQQKPPCQGKNCAEIWPSTYATTTTTAAASIPAASRVDNPVGRLPLDAKQPFVVGPTSYQYFFDTHQA